MPNDKSKLIEEGINYLRIISNANRRGELYTAEDVSEDLEIPASRVRAAIAAAKAHKDKTGKIPAVELRQPYLNIHRNLMTGHKQALESVKIELLKEIVVKNDDAEITEFTTLMPVKITIRRTV